MEGCDMFDSETPLHQRRDWHVSRHWTGTRIEDTCPCEKALCGMVPLDRTHPSCPEHPPERCKSIRRSHLPEDCAQFVQSLASGTYMRKPYGADVAREDILSEALQRYGVRVYGWIWQDDAESGTRVPYVAVHAHAMSRVVTDLERRMLNLHDDLIGTCDENRELKRKLNYAVSQGFEIPDYQNEDW